MKVNKWTMGLAAVGLVTLPSLVQAEEKASSVMTALSSTTISGYVDTSAVWNPNTGNANSPGFSYNAGKQDGFNLNAVKLTIEKPLDEGQWAAGYKADLLFGPDANAYATTSSGTTTSDFAIKQAYVQLRAPVGNGLDFKMGVFDTIVGYETFDAVNNPNYTRSYGFTIEPTTHTGLLATYAFSEAVSASVGIANTTAASINSRAHPPQGPKAESYKSYMASVTLTAPKDMGALAGSMLYMGIVNGYNGVNGNQANAYIGTTINTGVKNLKVGAAYDYAGVSSGSTAADSGPYAWAASVYASFQLAEKWSVHARGEYMTQNEFFANTATSYTPTKVVAGTVAVQYDLWKNVLSRLELRWDHAADGKEGYGGTVAGTPTLRNAYMVAANVIYKF